MPDIMYKVLRGSLHLPQYGSMDLLLECAQLVANFVQDLFPLASGSPQASFIGGWLWLVPSMLSQSPALDHAAQALAFGYYGKQSRSKDTLQRSYFAYGHALRSLSKDMQNPQHKYASETLCSALILLHYERFLHPSERSWVSHIGGIRRLIQQRGVESFQSGIDHAVLMASKGYIITESLLAGETCFLDEKTWQGVAFAAVDSPFTPANYIRYHEGLKLFASIPGLLKEVRTVALSDESKRNRTYALAQDLRSRLTLWQCSHKTTSEINLTTDSEGNYIYRDSIEASFMVNYFAYLILLNQILDNFQSPPIHEQENELLAHQLAKSIYFCSKTGFCGADALDMALPIALTVAMESDKALILAYLADVQTPTYSLKAGL